MLRFFMFGMPATYNVRYVAVVFLGGVLSGCGAHNHDVSAESARRVAVTKAAPPTVVQPYARIDDTLACIRSTGALSGRTFVVGPFADSTGKINAAAIGATGAFVPQGGSASYITDAIRRAGGSVVSTYFGAPAVNTPAQYSVNGIFNSLDFGTDLQADVRVAGIGPTSQIGWAQLSLSIQLDAAGTRINRQMSMIQRPVRYSSVGAGVGSALNRVLVTGNVVMQNQERLQFEALNGPIALGIADVLMKEFPVARKKCGTLIADLLNLQDLAEEPAQAAAEPQRSPATPQSVPSSVASAPTPAAQQAVAQPARQPVQREAPQGEAFVEPQLSGPKPPLNQRRAQSPGLNQFGDYSIQLGVWPSREAAEENASLFSTRFGAVFDGKSAGVVRNAGSGMFPVRVAGLDRDRAHRACERIKEQGGACVVVRTN